VKQRLQAVVASRVVYSFEYMAPLVLEDRESVEDVTAAAATFSVAIASSALRASGHCRTCLLVCAI
jgi:hypothetical protein